MMFLFILFLRGIRNVKTKIVINYLFLDFKIKQLIILQDLQPIKFRSHINPHFLYLIF